MRSAELFLEGREDDVSRLLGERMEAASAAQRYEEAALFRDQIRALSRVQARQYVESARGMEADVVACAIVDGIACVNLAMIRGGRHVGDRSFFPANADGNELIIWEDTIGGKERMRRLLEVVRHARVDLTPLLTHSFALEEIKEGYRIFGERLDGVLKVAIKP